MRRILIAVLCCLMLITAVSAASSATDLQSNTVVKSDGTCEVTLTLQLQLDEVPADLLFPLPAQAKDITLNGSPARTSTSGSFRNVDLSGAVHFAGNYTFVIHYALPDSITTNKQEQLVLTLHLLSGFAYPIEKMQFAVTLPGQPEKRPEFISTYHQETVDTLMNLTIEGSEIRGSFLTELKDHESLTMTLVVPEDQFPQPISKQWSLSMDDLITYFCAVLALIYWLLTMRCLPHLASRRPTVPEGICAGQMGSYLIRRTAELPLMVLQWAQLGYLIIHLDDNGRVFLHKKMDMGNERSTFELRCFRDLFGRKQMMDVSSSRFQSVCEKCAAMSRRQANGYQSPKASAKLFRVISALLGMFAGVAMGDAIATNHYWRPVLMGGIGLVCMVLCWFIQEGMGCLHLRSKADLKLGAVASAVLLIAGAVCGCMNYALAALVWNLIAGAMAFYGGRRSENGIRIYTEILGLRRHLRRAGKKELQRILASNRNYYFELAPYALAFGMDRKFAEKFGNARLPACTWLASGIDSRTAPDWYPQLRQVYNAMIRDRKPTLAERIFGK